MCELARAFLFLKVERIASKLLEAALDPAMGLARLKHLNGLKWQFIVVDRPDVRFGARLATPVLQRRAAQRNVNGTRCSAGRHWSSPIAAGRAVAMLFNS